MKKQEAMDVMYSLWENGYIPSNFTEDHSEYSDAVIALMKVSKNAGTDVFLETINDFLENKKGK